jgi:hypothetical protein
VDGAVFVRIDIRPSVAGTIADLLYKNTRLRITLNLADGETRRYRLVSGMSRTGFILSPLISDSADMMLLYGDVGALTGKRVKSFVVDAPVGRRLWRARYTASFEQVATPEDRGVLKLMALQPSMPPQAGASVQAAVHCDAAIDAVNGGAPTPSILASRTLSLRGWVAASTNSGTPAPGPLLALTDPKGARTFFEMRPVARPDVARVFGKPQLEASGFSVLADVSALHGDYVLSLAYREGGAVKVCPQPAIPVRLD